MGDPKHQEKKFETPSHPWKEGRMEQESHLLESYGLKNKEELWKAESELRKYRRKARELLAKLGGVGETPESAEREEEELVSKFQRLALLDQGEGLGEILTLGTRDLLDRRLQTVVYRKGLANTPKQARQFVVHGHIEVDGKRTTIPSYKVGREEENTVRFLPDSPYANEAHPEVQ